MAAAQVLNSPELLSLILQCFEEQEQDGFPKDNLIKFENRSTRSSLAKIARVNHLYFEAATRVLWAYEYWGPSLGDLSNIEASRQQLYASKLATIRITRQTEHTLESTTLSFPRVRRLNFPEIGRRNGLQAASVKHYLRPSIDSIILQVWDRSFNKELLAVITSQCPRLRSLILIVHYSTITDITPRDFDEFLRKQPLERVHIDVGSPWITKGLFSTLGEMENLRSLSIVSALSLQQIPECFLVENVGFFKNLYQVDFEIKREAVSSMTMAIRHASRVKITVVSPRLQHQTPMFLNLKHMKNLVDLTINFKGKDLYLDGEDFGCLRTLGNLEHLAIKRSSPFYPPPKLENFNDPVLDAIFGLPRLQSFSWHLCWLDVSVETLSAFSRHSPNLTDIILHGAFDLEALAQVSDCLFPKLQNLSLGSAVHKEYSGEIPINQIAAQILYHAPKLKELKFQDDLLSKVVDAWKQLKEEKEARDIIDLARALCLSKNDMNALDWSPSRDH
jgi:hypothetical protein